MWTWGRNNAGKLGLGNGDDIGINIPTQVGTANDWKSISVGSAHTLAIKNDGTLWSWGSDGWGQLGNGDSSTENILTPSQVGISSDWIFVSASKGIGSGGNFSLGLKAEGTLWVWGCNEFGVLGTSKGDKSYSSVPIQANGDTNWLLAETGSDHILALKNDGTLWSWGNNYSGQLRCLPIQEATFVITKVNDDTV